MAEANNKIQQTILDIDHVSIAYDRAQEYAVEDVSFSVHRGEYICLIGSNGSGKSTLMKSIVGLVPISKGSVNLKIAPDAFAYMGHHMIWRRLALMPQESL